MTLRAVGDVTAPRHIAPGKLYMVTRRTERRFFLLKPDPVVTHAFLYCLGVFAPRFGVALHEVVLLSTHFHVILTDVDGRLPELMHALDRTMALVVKTYWGWEGRVWDGNGASYVELATPEAALEKHAYVAANPVAAGAVRFAREWPGLTTRLDELGKKVWVAKKPRVFLDQTEGVWPDEVEVRLVWCRALDFFGTRDAVLEKLRRAVEALEREAQEEHRAKGWSFLGAARVLSASPFRRAKTREPTRALNPTFAVGHGQPEAYLEAVARRRAFLAAYREALHALRAGRRLDVVVFPHGTWWMRVFFGCTVAPAPD